MTEIKREYSCSDVDMLSVSATIAEHAIEHKPFLISKRSSWADPYFSDFSARINAAFSNHLGIDNAKEMRSATAVVKGLRKAAIAQLAEFKVQIEEDFKKKTARRDEILNLLGFLSIPASLSRATHSELVQILF